MFLRHTVVGLQRQIWSLHIKA